MGQGQAVDAVTIKTDKKDILDAIQKAGYTYQEGATQTVPGTPPTPISPRRASSKTYRACGVSTPTTILHSDLGPDRAGCAGRRAFGPDWHRAAQRWPGGTTESLVKVLTTLLQRAAGADQKKVTNVEVFDWKGDNYKPDGANTIKSAVMDRLQKLGFTADAGAPDTGAAMTYFRAHNGPKAIQGLWRKSDTGLILAWGALGDAGQ